MKNSAFIQSLPLTAILPGRKAGRKSGMKGAKKATARGSRGKNIEGSKENALHREAKKTSDDSMDEDDSKERENSPVTHVC